VIPAWTLLERKSIAALLAPEPRLPSAIRVASTAPPADVAAVPVVRATRAFIKRADASGGLTLTPGGALSRADTKALFDLTEWPDYDRASVLALNKVLNEDDVLPIQFTRMIAQDARLLRAARHRLLATKRATALLDPSGTSNLFRTMFETAFWRVNLAYFDRLPVEHWPQTHIGVVLWSLSVAAHDWTKPEALLATCTMPELGTGAGSEISSYAMITRVLRPLTWFGLMECKPADFPKVASGRLRLYRKTALFDRILSFEVDFRPSGPVQ
jgi:hypothetical protein